MGSGLNALCLKTNRITVWFISAFLVTCSFFSILIPPLQSPDEFDHIKRAYWLSKGIVVLKGEKGQSSGGPIDSGLSSYLAAYSTFPTQPDAKVSLRVIDSAKSIHWTNTLVFSPAPGTAFYFPVIYLPQAVGLALGEHLGFSIDISYRMAKLLANLYMAAVLLFAFWVYPTNLFTIALLIIPMSIAQFSSASLDGMATAVSIFAISAFLRISRDKQLAPTWLFPSLALSVALLVTSRVHLLPLLLLPFAVAFILKARRYYLMSALLVVFVILWLFVAVTTTVDLRMPLGMPTAKIISFYVQRPLAFFEVLGRTLANGDTVRFYYQSFLGMLGALTIKFPEEIYVFMSVILSIIGILSFSVQAFRSDLRAHSLLVLVGCSSFLLVFAALLVTWTAHPATEVQGIQGRYFLIPFIFLAYAICRNVDSEAVFFQKICYLLLAFLLYYVILSTARLVIERYYILLDLPDKITVKLRPSTPLQVSAEIPLLLADSMLHSAEPLKGMDILFGTYSKRNAGMAELRLISTDGMILNVPIELRDLEDNKYAHFSFDSRVYISGSIVGVTGGGISSWEAHEDGVRIATCIVYEYSNGFKDSTKGCPRL
jgi:uncharacterized membrane protein